MNDYTWMVGGESGEGIDTTGELFALALCRMGYHVHGERLFPSRIRGGHTHYQLRIADRSLRAPSGRIDCLVAFDQGSIDWNWRAMAPGGLIVHDAVFRAQLPAARDDLRAVAVPLSDLASAIGDAIMKNMVAVGVSAALLGLPVDPFLEAAASRFAGKGPEIAAANAELVRRGHAEGSRLAAAGAPPFAVRPDPPPSGRHRYLLSGNEALAYGALAAGCRFVAAYPITPATEIMQWLQRELPAYGGAVVQCEDELAAVNMVVGAAFAGARAMASTSGPGFSLMTEGLGLAGATEQPIVIVDDQRAGPSTGLPTRSEQSDLQHAAWGGHGEFPRIVITPLGVEDCFAAAVDAFNLAERYQCPVILAPDLGLAMCRQSIDGLDFARVRIERGALADPEALAAAAAAGRRFPRYQLTPSGISPRPLPGQAGGQHLVTGSEHNEVGDVNDTPDNRRAQHGKRLHKLAGFREEGAVVREGPERAELLLLGFGGSTGAIAEAAERLRAEGRTVARAHVRIPHPFPAAAVAAAVAGAAAVLVVEGNGLGQLANLVRQHVPAAHGRLHSCLHYDGTPLLAATIVAAAEGVDSAGHAG